MDLATELSYAVDAVRAATAVCQRVRATLVDAETLEKRDRSPVTVADFASQALVCRALVERSGITRIVGEESAGALRGDDAAELRRRVHEQVAAAHGGAPSENDVLGWIDAGGYVPDADASAYWTLDPIDGTKGFLRNEHYAVALGLLVDGEVVIGVLGCPGLDALFTAVRGQGAHSLPLAGGGEPKPIRVSTLAQVADARFCESVESGHSDQGQSAAIAARLGITAPPLRMDSQAKYAAVARGDASIYMRLPTRADYREKIWDHAAGMLVVTEAGGIVTDIAGAPLGFGHGPTLEPSRGVIATNGAFHDAVVEAVAAG